MRIFLAVNPRGVLPVLEIDDGTRIDESVAICRYFEELHPDPPLFGTDALSRALVESWNRHAEFDGMMDVALPERLEHAQRWCRNVASLPAAKS